MPIIAAKSQKTWWPKHRLDNAVLGKVDQLRPWFVGPQCKRRKPVSGLRSYACCVRYQVTVHTAKHPMGLEEWASGYAGLSQRDIRLSSYLQLAVFPARAKQERTTRCACKVRGLQHFAPSMTHVLKDEVHKVTSAVGARTFTTMARPKQSRTQVGTMCRFNDHMRCSLPSSFH